MVREPGSIHESCSIQIDPIVCKARRKTARGARGRGSIKSKQPQDPSEQGCNLKDHDGENDTLDSSNSAVTSLPLSGKCDSPVVITTHKARQSHTSLSRSVGVDTVEIAHIQYIYRVSLKKAAPFDLLQEAPSPKPAKTSVTLTKNPSRGIAKTRIILTKNPFREGRNSKKERKW